MTSDFEVMWSKVKVNLHLFEKLISISYDPFTGEWPNLSTLSAPRK